MKFVLSEASTNYTLKTSKASQRAALRINDLLGLPAIP